MWLKTKFAFNHLRFAIEENVKQRLLEQTFKVFLDSSLALPRRAGCCKAALAAREHAMVSACLDSVPEQKGLQDRNPFSLFTQSRCYHDA